ncbi:MAG: nucleotidyltransferase domain-containing protein [Candidatus Sumerlaeota bacterium]|nr:nucleotidyltransferase domain-containing protein [Candidatus Sumerlaeota bacterium]
MKSNDRKILTSLSEELRRRFPDARIWAFGSRVHETSTKYSDFDVCIVIDNLDENKDREIMRTAWEVGFENDVVISTVTYSTEEFKNGPCSASSLVRTILSEGITA